MHINFGLLVTYFFNISMCAGHALHLSITTGLCHIRIIIDKYYLLRSLEILLVLEMLVLVPYEVSHSYNTSIQILEIMFQRVC